MLETALEGLARDSERKPIDPFNLKKLKSAHASLIDIKSQLKYYFYDYLYARYYTLPPEESASQLSAEIVQQFAKEFDVDSFATEEAMMLDNVVAEVAKENVIESVLCDTSGPVDAAMEIERQQKIAAKNVIFLGKIIAAILYLTKSY